MTNNFCPLCILVVILTGCSQEKPEDLARDEGEKLFSESCAACHGKEGRGPSMADLRALPSAELREAIRNHPTAGDLLERLTAADIGSLIEYLEE